MKKVIALALALSMAASMGVMAADLNAGLIVSPSTGCGDEPGVDGQMLPGNEYHFAIDDYFYELAEDGVNNGDVIKELDTKLFNVSADWDKGSALVESVKIDNDCGDVVITLKENYTIEDEKDLAGSIELTTKKAMFFDGKAQKKGTKVSFDLEDATVANNTEDIDGADKKDDATEVDVLDNTIYKMNSSGWVEFCGDGNRLSSVKVRLPEDKKVFAYFNEDVIEEVEDKYYDLDADISYINFVAKPNLGSKADIAIQGDYSDKYHLYEYANGKLTEIDADWNEDDGLFEFKASKLGAYVISDKALKATADEDADKTDDTETTDDTTTKNPDTGANDVVGVAVALAAVSLVAAGAVSLKK